MKRILFCFAVCFALLAMTDAVTAQSNGDIRRRNITADRSFKLKHLVDSIKNDTTNIQNDDNSLITASAIYDFVVGRVNNGGGGGGFFFPNQMSPGATTHDAATFDFSVINIRDALFQSTGADNLGGVHLGANNTTSVQSAVMGVTPTESFMQNSNAGGTRYIKYRVANDSAYIIYTGAPAWKNIATDTSINKPLVRNMITGAISDGWWNMGGSGVDSNKIERITPPRVNALSRKMPSYILTSSTAFSGSYASSNAALFGLSSASVSPYPANSWLSNNLTSPYITLHTPRIVMIGNSITEGHPNTHGWLHTGGANFPGQISYTLEKLIGIPVINHGIASETVEQYRGRWRRDVLGDSAATRLIRKADYVIIGDAINDVFGSRTFEQIKADYEYLVASARANNIPAIIFTTSGHNSYASGSDTRFIEAQKVNAWLKGTYGEQGKGGVLIYDYYKLVKSASNDYNLNAALMEDAIHPTKAAYYLVANDLYKKITETDFIPTLKNLVIHSAFDLTNPPSATGRPLSVTVTGSGGTSYTYTLDNVPVNVVGISKSFPADTTYKVAINTVVAPSEVSGMATPTKVAITGLAITDAEEKAQLPVDTMFLSNRIDLKAAKAPDDAVFIVGGFTMPNDTDTTAYIIGSSSFRSRLFINGKRVSPYYYSKPVGSDVLTLQNGYRWAEGDTVVLEFYNPSAASITIEVDPSSYDADAQIYFAAVSAAGGTLSAIEKDAFSNYVAGLKTDGNWSKLKLLYPFMGGNAASNAINAKSPGTYNITWSGTVTHSATGVDFDGTTGYGNTNFDASSGMSDINSSHLSLYVMENVQAVGQYADIGFLNGTTSGWFTQIKRNDGTLYFDCGTSASRVSVAGNTNAIGYYVESRTSSTLSTVYKDGSSFGSNSSANTATHGNFNIKMLVGALNTATVPANYSARKLGFVTIGDGLSSGEADNMDSRFQTFKTAVGK